MRPEMGAPGIERDRDGGRRSRTLAQPLIRRDPAEMAFRGMSGHSLAQRPSPGKLLVCRGKVWLSEADAGTRTPDPIITSDVLYQLSYVGVRGEV
jgi:hypothetical protein